MIKNVVPNHIEHELSKEMAEKSEIINLLVVPFHQNKTADVCKYLKYMTDVIYDIHRKSEDDKIDAEDPGHTPSSNKMAARKSEILKGVIVSLFGNFLGRERLTDANKTKARCNFSSDKFEQVVEVPAVWHGKQFFFKCKLIDKSQTLNFTKP